MAQFTADIAGMLEIFAIAGGLVLLHVARKDEGDTRLLSLSGWLLIVGGVASGLCPIAYWVMYHNAGLFDVHHVSSIMSATTARVV